MRDVIIVGAGITGLTAATELQKRGVDWVIVESENAPGGRIQTDSGNGYHFDRGFQVFLSAYPEAKKYLDYSKLNLQPFVPGAVVLKGDRRYIVADPFRYPAWLFKSLTSGIGTLKDKFLVYKLRNQLKDADPDAILAEPELPTHEYLLRWGFSEDFIRDFFVPFFSGIFLEKELQTSSRIFRFVFKMMGEGDVCLPAAGIGAIPAQLASGLPEERLCYGQWAVSWTANSVVLANGEVLQAKRVLVTVPARKPGHAEKGHSVSCFYFAAPVHSEDKPVLILNGNAKGRINHYCFMDAISTEYAHKGALISVTVLGESAGSEANAIRDELATLSGIRADDLKFLRHYSIGLALPDQTLVTPGAYVQESEGVLYAGDYLSYGSMNAAFRAGREAAARL